MRKFFWAQKKEPKYLEILVVSGYIKFGNHPYPPRVARRDI
jgi:hypothetical protein